MFYYEENICKVEHFEKDQSYTNQMLWHLPPKMSCFDLWITNSIKMRQTIIKQLFIELVFYVVLHRHKLAWN